MASSSKLCRLKRQMFALQGNQKYHLFASYCDKDKQIVREFIGAMENFGLKINDPDRDFVPGEPVFRNIVERGLEISKMFIMFITKNFVSSPWCSYESDLAVWKYITTKGKYRVIPVVLEPCKVPPNLKVLNCVHAWKYRMKKMISKVDAEFSKFNFMLIERILKAITSPPLKFRRFRWIGMKTFNRGNNLVKKMRLAVMKDKTKDEAISTTLNPFNYLKLLAVLDHCVLHCKYGHCGFCCSGRNFLRFNNHMNSCRYRPTECTNKKCRYVCPNWELSKHVNECEFTQVRCDYDGCKTLILRCNLAKHQEVCPFRPVICPNRENGCEILVLPNDRDSHLQTCDFVEVQCENCENRHVRKFKDHHMKHCPLNVVECNACHSKTMRKDLSYHQDRCPMIRYECENYGCNIVLTKAQMLAHKNDCTLKISRCSNLYCGFEGTLEIVERHKSVCEYRQIKCEDCGRYVSKKDFGKHQAEHKAVIVCEFCKMSFTCSSRHAHQKWICPRRNFVSQCDICYDYLPFHELENHKSSHYEKNETATFYKVVEGECSDTEFLSSGSSSGGSDFAVSNEDCANFSSEKGEHCYDGWRNDNFMKVPAERKKHNSESSEWYIDSLITLATEPRVISPAPPSNLTVNQDYSDFGTATPRKQYGTSLKKFRNFMKAIDENSFILSLISRNRKTNRALNNSGFRGFLNSC